MKVFVLLVSVFFAPLAISETIQYSTPVCLAEEDLDEFWKYIAKNDRDGMTQLVDAGLCTILPEGVSVSVVSRGLATSVIRFQGEKLFVNSEAVGK